MNRPQQKRNNQLRKARKAAGLTQEQLAEKILVSPKSVNRWETGKSTPHPSVLQALCTELAKTAAELGFGDPEEASPEEEEQPVLQPPEQKQFREKQRQSSLPLQVPLKKRTSPPPRQRNFHLMIGIISTLVVAILVGGVAMAAFPRTPRLEQSDCGQPFSGTFHGRLDARWHWYNPSKSAALCINPQGSFSITAPPDSDLNPSHRNLNAPRLLQSITSDFTIQIHLQFHPTRNFQSAGLLLWQDSTKFLRFERTYGLQNGLLFQKNDNNSFSSIRQSKNHLTSAQSLDLRVQKQGDHFIASWREPGHLWQIDGETDLHFDRLMVGLDVLAVYGAPQTTATFTSFTVSCG